MSLLDTLQKSGLKAAPETVPSLQEATVLIPDAGFGLLIVEGQDRAKFLHNFCTNEIKKLQPGDVCEAFFCNVKGRILALGIIACLPEKFLILTDASRVEFLHQHLDRYLITEDVTLTIADEQTSLLLLTGPNSDKLATNEAEVAVIPWTGWIIPARWVIGPTESLVQIAKTGVENGAILAGHDTAEVLRISAGYPRYGIDISDENLAQEANRNEQAISFTKGCYLGQEPIARLDAMGHVNRELERFCYEDSDSPPAVGSPVVTDTGEEVGTVTSACQLPSNAGLDDGRGFLLAMLKVTSKQAEELIARTNDGETVILDK